MALKLYWNKSSQPSRAIKALLIGGDVKHEECKMGVFDGESRTPEYLAINPAGGLPCITKDGKCYNESQAVLRWLCYT